jgi:hypothetical protein
MNFDGPDFTTHGDDVDQQRWIDELLRSPAARQWEAAPRATFAAALKRRRRRGLALGMAAAASVAAAMAWAFIAHPGRIGPGIAAETLAVSSRPKEAKAIAPPSPLPTRQVKKMPAAAAEATFVSSSDAIAVPLESPAANVTVVKVYPTVNAQRRLQLAATLSSLTSEPNGG